MLEKGNNGVAPLHLTQIQESDLNKGPLFKKTDRQEEELKELV